jgi:hypothetical protein
MKPIVASIAEETIMQFAECARSAGSEIFITVAVLWSII